jgi:hypothetical protein
MSKHLGGELVMAPVNPGGHSSDAEALSAETVLGSSHTTHKLPSSKLQIPVQLKKIPAEFPGNSRRSARLVSSLSSVAMSAG